MNVRCRFCAFIALMLLFSVAAEASGNGFMQRLRGGETPSEASEESSPSARFESEHGKHFIPVILESDKEKPNYTKFAINGMTGATGVAYFGDRGESLNCADVLTDAITQRLIDNSRYKIVTREHVEKIFGEQKLVWGGGFDTATSARLGNLLGVEVLIFAKASYCEMFSRDDEDGPGNASYTSTNQIQAGPQGGGASNLAANVAHAAGESRAAGAIGVAAQLIQSSRQKRRERKASEQATDGPPVNEHFARLRAMVYALDLSTGEKILSTSQEVTRGSGYEMNPEATSGRLLMVRAADEIAGDFVDRLLVRPDFDFVQMCTAQNVDLEPGNRLVRLGDCTAAAEYFEQTSVDSAHHAGDETNGRILHNHGIALMCAGN